MTHGLPIHIRIATLCAKIPDMEITPLDPNGTTSGDARREETHEGGRVVLPPRRVAPIPVQDDESIGLRIGPASQQSPDADESRAGTIEIVEHNQSVTRLGKESHERVKAPGEIKFVERASRSEMQRRHRGETEAWGKDQPYPVRWIVGSFLGVLVCAVLGFVVVSAVNQNDVPKRDPVLVPAAADSVDAGKDLVAEELINSSKEASQIFESFVRAKTTREIMPLIRNAPGVGLLIKKANKTINAPSDWKVDESAEWVVDVDGEIPIATLSGTLPDGDGFHAYFTHEDDNLLMDWKATTAYSTATFIDLRRGEGNASEIRGFLEPSVFYTPSLPEADFQSFSFVSPDGYEAVWVYVKRGSELCDQLVGYFSKGVIIDESIKRKPLTLALEQGPEGSLPNQWLVSFILAEEWIITEPVSQ